MALLEVKNLNKHFKVPQGLLYAVNDVSFTLDANSTLGVVGESGCGKSTLGRVIIHLLEKTSGQIWFDGEDISDIKRDGLKELRHKMQMIFQDPYSSLNPKMTVSDIIGEPLRIFSPKISRTEYEKRSRWLWIRWAWSSGASILIRMNWMVAAVSGSALPAP